MRAFTPQLPIDKIFGNEGKVVELKLSERQVLIENLGFSKSVIWHPGKPHSLSDVPAYPELAEFICCESLTEIVALGPSNNWNGSVKYSV